MGLVRVSCLCLLGISASAAEFHVGPSGDHSTIQAALNAAAEGDEIIVSPGLYVENILIAVPGLVLRSTAPENPTVVATTIIDGDQKDPVVQFGCWAGPDFVLEGFTIRNGRSDANVELYGGGICGYGVQATIRNNVITLNVAGAQHAVGGGLHNCDGPIYANTITSNSVDAVDGEGGGLYGCDGEIYDNTITSNSAGTGASRGGGLAHCDGHIHDNIITENVAGDVTGQGGGLYGCDSEIYDNTISKNIAGDVSGQGGGLCECDAEIYNNTITENVAGYFGGHGGGLYGCDGPIRNNVISNNEALGYAYDADAEQCVGSAGIGGGLSSCGGVIEDNLISENFASGDGGGLANCGGLITGNDIMSNIAEGCEYEDNLCRKGNYPNGGGLHGCDGSIEDNTISFNEARVFIGSGEGSPRCSGMSGPSGGGLSFCGGEISDNTVSHNVADDVGDGGGFASCNGLIRDNLILGNVASRYGGGLSGCVGIVERNDIRENEALSGGGLSGCGLVQHNKIHRNKAVGNFPKGGGVCGASILEHNVIYANEARATLLPGLGRGGGVGGGASCCGGTSSSVIRNCIIWGNVADMGDQVYGVPTPTYCCVQGGEFGGLYGGVGNVTADPLMTDPENGDFRILKDSPCIDTGMRIPGLLEDFEGQPRPFDARVQPLGDGSDYDIGMDEWHEFTLTMAIDGNGLTEPPAGNSPQPQWEMVAITAFPMRDWIFDYWEGDLTGSTNPTTVVMDGDKTVTAVFRPVGKGTVRLAASVRGKGCLDPGEGPILLSVGGTATLTAYPEIGWRFDHWEGTAAGDENPLPVMLQTSASLTAVFAKTRAPDVNRDRTLDAIDVQFAVLAALGFEIVPFCGDVNNDLRINTIDVQTVINAVLKSGQTTEYAP